jgi:hypothetical protein
MCFVSGNGDTREESGYIHFDSEAAVCIAAHETAENRLAVRDMGPTRIGDSYVWRIRKTEMALADGGLLPFASLLFRRRMRRRQ